MRDEQAGGDGERRDLDRILFQLNDVTIRRRVNTGGGKVKVISSKCAVPEGEVDTSVSDEPCEVAG